MEKTTVSDTYSILTVMTVEIDMIVRTRTSPIGSYVILVIMYIDAFIVP